LDAGLGIPLVDVGLRAQRSRCRTEWLGNRRLVGIHLGRQPGANLKILSPKKTLSSE
jgi:hypothetical protein